MEEFTSRALFHPVGIPLDLKLCCAEFQSWLDDRRKLPDRRVDWKMRKKLERRKCSSFAERRIMLAARMRLDEQWKQVSEKRADRNARTEQNRRKVCSFSVRRIIATARKVNELTANEKDVLADRLLRWLTRPYYLNFLCSLRMEALFFEEYLELSLPLSLPLAIQHDEAHYRKYMLYAFCAFAGFFRPSFNWQESSEHRRLAASLLMLFGRIARDKAERQKFIALLFDSRHGLHDIGAEFQKPDSNSHNSYSESEIGVLCEAFESCEGDWPKTIEMLASQGFQYIEKDPSGHYRRVTIKAAYLAKPETVTTILKRKIRERTRPDQGQSTYVELVS
jgi:hypothetical protein